MTFKLLGTVKLEHRRYLLEIIVLCETYFFLVVVENINLKSSV